MSQYIHHVPGRLRVRSRSFRCRPDQMDALANRLMRMSGVETVGIKRKAGSITVRYDPVELTRDTLLEEFEQAGCFEVIKQQGTEERPVGDLAQKALVGTLVQMTVERSVRSLVGALL